jgi:PAS domain S-box-containing protein
MNDTPNNLSPDSAFCQLFNQSADPSLLLTHTQIIASNTAANFLLKGFRKTIISQELSDLAPSNQPDGISSQISALTHVKAAYQYGSDRFTWSMQTCNEIILPVEILLTRITAGEDFFLHAVIREKISNTNHEQDVLAIERDLGIILGETNNLQDALMLILTASLHLEGVDCGGIYLIEEDSKNLKLQASINLSDDYISKTSIYSKDSPIMKQVLEGRPMYGIISSIMGELDEIRKKEGLLAVASIPIHSGGEIIGTLNIGSRTTPQLNNDAKIAIELLSSQIGGAIARIRGAELLAKTQYNLHHLFDSIDDLLFIIDFNGQLISTNQAVQQKLHYSSEELASMNVCELHSPEDITLVTSTFSQMIDGTKTTCTIPLLTKEGNSIPVETRVSRGWWSGRPVFFGISRDITEENIIRHKLIETLDFNEKIIESSSLGIVAFRADDGQCIMANESAVNIIGATKNQILEQNFRSIPSWKKSNIIKIAEESLQKWIRNRAELNFKTSFGKQIWIDVIFVPFSANNIPHLLLIFDEITGRKKSQEAIRKKEGILNSIARAARSFLTNTTREETILAMLQDMGTVMEVDRVYIFQNHFDEETGEHLTSQRYEWTCANIEKQRNNELLQNTPFSMIPDWEIQLKFGNHISGVVTSFQNPVRDFLHQQGIISILLVPIRIGEDFWGFIGFDDCHTERVWTRTETTVLKVAADIIGGAIGRKLTEEALIAKKQELLDIINHLPDATMVVDHNRKVIAWNRAMEELTGYGADEMLGKGDYQYAIPFYGEKRPILVDYILNPDEIINQESAGNIIIDSVLSGEFTVQRDDSCRHLSARAH